MISRARRAWLSLVLAGCATVSGQHHTPDPALPRRIILVGAWSDCSGNPAEVQLVDILSRETGTLDPLLKKLANQDAEVIVLENPEPATLLNTLANDHRPLWFIYNGISTIRENQSYLCLRNGKVSVDQIIEARPPESPYATYLINGCHSAYVDPRRDNTVVISAGPELVGNVDNKIVLGQDLAAGLTKGLDLDGNGMIDTRELFMALERVHIHENPVAVKLRSQSWRPLPLFSLGKENASVQPALPKDLLAMEKDFRAGRAAPTVARPPVLWWIPKQLDGLQQGSTQIRRIDTSESARTIAAASMATLVVGVEEQLGSLVARDLGTGGVIWTRPANLPGQTQLQDRDIQDILYGFEKLDKGRLRRYLNPLTASQRKELETAGFSARPCQEPKGQCFGRISPAGGLP